MSEEQSGFKVTDRRLFNPDGTPREVSREEEPRFEAVVEETPPVQQPAENTGEQPGPERKLDEYEPELDHSDPASFVNFLMSIASNAAASLGMMEHPVTGQRGVDLAVGKHWIDVLGMLERKTRGNLDQQEAEILEGILADLRMQYVSLNTAKPGKSERGLTGDDILGRK
jgi:uncharacterized protein DUF1844